MCDVLITVVETKNQISLIFDSFTVCNLFWVGNVKGVMCNFFAKIMTVFSKRFAECFTCPAPNK